MQVLRLLAARRRAVAKTITAAPAPARPSEEVFPADSEPEEDEGPFFDLDFSSSVRASSSSSSGSEESDDACSSDLDFIISLHRSRSASPSYRDQDAATTLFFQSEPSTKAGLGLVLRPQYDPKKKRSNKRGATTSLRTLSFGAAKHKFYCGRPSFAGSARSLRLFMESPADDDDDEDVVDACRTREPANTRPSRDVIKRYLTKISRRFRSVRAAGDTTRGRLHNSRLLRKSRSASAAETTLAPPSRRDDSLVEKLDGIASAIAHCKESFHRASLSECDSSSLIRSRSDPGKRAASSS